MAMSFVDTIKRDYVYNSDCVDADEVLKMIYCGYYFLSYKDLLIAYNK